MPLTRADKRQDILEKLLDGFGEMDIDLSGDGDVLANDLVVVMNTQLAVLTYLALNVRDCMLLLNRSNPDGQPPDGEIPVIGQRVTPESAGEGTEPGTESETKPVTDAEKAAVVPPGEEEKNQ